MNQITVPPVSSHSFSASVNEDGMSVRAKFSGTADMEVHAQLTSFLDQLHAALTEQDRRRVIADICELYFMNSSCLKLFVVWVGRAAKLSPETRYRVAFLMDPKLQWQRRTLEAMRAFAPAVLEIEEA